MQRAAETPNSVPSEAAAAFRDWMVGQALPVWADIGFDRSSGGFHERLRLDGSPEVEAPRRLRVQARQIYVYAHAAVLGWHPDARSLALTAFESLCARYHAPDGRPGFVHRVSADGALEDPMRDLYDHAFVLLALAWLSRATGGDAQITALIDDTLAFLDAALAIGDGSYRESEPAALPRRQNPHMHLFEAMLALHQAGHPDGLRRAAALQALLDARFLDATSGALREYFDASLAPWPGPQGVLGEPGHHAEWAWLLRRHEALAGLPPGSRAATLLHRAAATADPLTGLLIDEVDAANRPLARSRRVWPQTEAAKAWLAEHEIGQAGAADAAARILNGLLAQYLAPAATPGTWINQLDPSGRPMDAFIPASTLYHLFGAAAEAERVLLTPATAASRQAP